MLKLTDILEIVYEINVKLWNSDCSWEWSQIALYRLDFVSCGQRLTGFGTLTKMVDRVAQYSDWLRAGRSGIDSRWGRDFPPVQTGPGAHPASCTMGAGSFPGVKCGRVVLLTTNTLLVPRSWKSRAIPLPTLWVTPDLSREHFTFTYSHEDDCCS